MPAVQCFIFDLEKSMKLAQIFCQMQNVFIFVEKEMFFYRMFWVRDFIILCYNPEYKRQ